MYHIKKWVKTTRLETVTLALSSIGLGSALAAFTGTFDWRIGVLAALTASLLQIICNLANDYGDLVHGADAINDVKPLSALQTDLVSLKQVKHAVQVLVVLTLGLGATLLCWAALTPMALGFFVFLGVLAVLASITYTAGNKPYGYRGWGDVAVLIFFGFVGVGGTFYLHTRQLSFLWLLPAMSYGSLVVGVLNVNNIRDLCTDAQVGKKTITVRIGRKAALYYHWCLLAVSIGTILIFLLCYAHSPWPYVCLCVVPSLLRHGMAVSRRGPAQLTEELQNLVCIILVFIALLSVGLVLAMSNKSGDMSVVTFFPSYPS